MYVDKQKKCDISLIIVFPMIKKVSFLLCTCAMCTSCQHAQLIRLVTHLHGFYFPEMHELCKRLVTLLYIFAI